MGAALKKETFTEDSRNCERLDITGIYASGKCSWVDRISKETCSVVIHNISSSGVCVQTIKKIDVGTELAIDIDIPSPAKVKGRLVWTKQVDGVWMSGVNVTEGLGELNNLFAESLFI